MSQVIFRGQNGCNRLASARLISRPNSTHLRRQRSLQSRATSLTGHPRSDGHSISQNNAGKKLAR